MAILEAKVSAANTGWDVPEVCPAGTQVAICLEIKDVFDVTRGKYEDPTQTEVVDLTRFLFGVCAVDGQLYRVQTHELKISAHERAGLMKLLTSWTAKPLSELIGWDYCEMQGKTAQLIVIHRTSKLGRVYAAIETVTPLHPQLAAAAPTLEAFAALDVPQVETPAQVAPSPAVNDPGQPTSHFGGEVLVQPDQPITTAEGAKTIQPQPQEEPPF